jgi:hypothetical protein
MNAGLIVAAVFGALGILTAMISLAWYIETSWYRPLLGQSNFRTAMVKTAIQQYLEAWLGLLFYVPIAALQAVAQVVVNVYANIWTLFFLFMLGSVAFGWLEYEDKLIGGWLQARQCILMPFTNYFLFPLANALRIVYDAVIIVWDLGYDYFAFYEYGPVIIFIKCTVATVDATNVFVYFANIPYVFVQDLTTWFQLGILDNELDVTNTLDAIGLFWDSLIAPLTCFCQAIGFFWQALAIWMRLPSLHSTINCILNFFVRLFQIPINTVMVTPHVPVFNLTALAGCCAVQSFGNLLEDTAFLVVQTGWGVFSNTNLPHPIAVFFSTHWSHIVSDPVCSLFLLANLTLTAGVHYDALNNADGSGIAYLQFGFIFDQWKSAAYAFGSLFILFNNDAVAFVTEALLSLVNGVAFLFEWILGNVFYWLFGGPLVNYPFAPYGSFSNFLKYYFPNYWLIPQLPGQTTALNDAFNAMFQTTQALGNLFGNLLDMAPLGGMIQHLLNILVCLVRVLMNLISFVFTISTFESDVRTTARQVDFDCIFNEMYYFAGSLGDFFRQFADNGCVADVDESEHSLFCCLGALVEQLVDVFTAVAQQFVHFMQDLLVLPTGDVHFCIKFIGFNASDTANCIRIPDLTVPLFLLDSAICEFTCALLSVIPLLSAFQCGFPAPPPPPPNTPPENPHNCGHVSTCTGDFLCKLLRIFIVPLKIANMYFINTINGKSYSDFTVLGQVWAQQFANWLADVVISFGQLIDCTLCAFVTHNTPNCGTAVYDLMLTVAQLIRFLPLILTRTFLIVTKLLMTVLIGIFTGNPIKAAVDFIVGLLENVFGGLAKAVIDFLVAIFNAIGLGFIGTFIQILYNGFCPLLEGIVNAIILILKAITLGLIPINFANFCCDGSPSCVPTTKRYEGQFAALAPGVNYIDQSNIMQFINAQMQWVPADPCNATMRSFEDVPLANLTDWQRGQVFFCLSGQYWLQRNDNASPMWNTTCDRLIIEYNGTDWFQIDPHTRSVMMDCMFDRLFMDLFRAGSNATWLPSDLLYNPYRKIVFGAELLRGLAIYWQFNRDQSVTSATFVSPVYQANWRSMNLNTSHYASVRTPLDIARFRTQYRLRDYFAWNGDPPQYEATVALTTGFWNFANHLLQSLANTSFSLGDETVDPTVLVTYDYFLGNSAAGIGSSFSSLFAELYQVGLNISSYWSQPSNLRKRQVAFDAMREGGWGMYQAATRELTKVAAEYKLSGEYWQGLRSPNETAAFLRDYHDQFHYNNRSVVYRLSSWWERNRATFLTVRSVDPLHSLERRYARLQQNVADGLPAPPVMAHMKEALDRAHRGDRSMLRNKTTALFQYRCAKTGALKSETGYERLWRFAAAVREGSPGSRRRWDGVMRVFNVVKERLYEGALRSNLAFATDYVRRTYQLGWCETVAAVQRDEAAAKQSDGGGAAGGFDDLVRAHYASMAESGTRLVSSRQRHDYAVYTLRAKSQALHCDATGVPGALLEDGLCKDYVRVPVVEVRQDFSTGGILAGGERGAEYSVFRAASEIAPGATPARGVVVPSNATVRYLTQLAVTRLGLVAAQTFLSLTCLTNITFGNSTLCEECFFMDQLIGRLESGLAWALGYFTGGQFGDALQVALNFMQYIADDGAYVVVGSGPALPVGDFPSVHGWAASMEYLNDDIPDKIGFSDLFVMLNNCTGGNCTNQTLPVPLSDINGINALVGYLITTVFNFWWYWVHQFYILLTGDSAQSTEGVFNFVIENWILCDWIGGTSYLGTKTRFSVGQMLFGVVSVQAIINIVLLTTIRWNFVNAIIVFVGNIAGYGMILSAFWALQLNFALLCYPGLPVKAVDTALYFVFYSVAAKCPWFWAYAITNADYNNTNCYPCNASANWNIQNSMRDRGFVDLGANIAFMLQKYHPDWLEWLRTTTILPIALIVDLPYIQTRLNAYAGLDLSSQPTYRNYVGGNYIGTLLPNAVLFAIFLYLLYIASPLFGFVVMTVFQLFQLLWRNFVMLQYMLTDMEVMAYRAPMIIEGYADHPVQEHVEERQVPRDADDEEVRAAFTPLSQPYVLQHAQPQSTLQRFTLQKRPSLMNMIQKTLDNMRFGDRKRR